jgi:hypothetical protein
MPQSAVFLRYAGARAWRLPPSPRRAIRHDGAIGRRSPPAALVLPASLTGTDQPPVTTHTVVTMPISTEKTATLRVRLT